MFCLRFKSFRSKRDTKRERKGEKSREGVTKQREIEYEIEKERAKSERE